MYSPNCCTKFGSTKLYRVSLHAVALYSPSNGTKEPKLCTKQGPRRHDLSRIEWMAFHRALALTLNTFEMNWNADCVPDLLARFQCLTSIMFL